MDWRRQRCIRITSRQTWAGLLLLMLILGAVSTAAVAAPTANPLWVEVAEASIAPQPAAQRFITPLAYRVLRLDQNGLRKTLAAAPLEFTASATEAPAVIELPMPDGQLKRFAFSESPVMHPALGAKFPELKTYKGYGLDHPADSVRFDLTPAGFHALILSPSGSVFIDPLRHGDTSVYQSYYKRDFRNAQKQLACLAEGNVEYADAGEESNVTVLAAPVIFRQYRLAMAATGEYTVFHGGTVALGLAGVVTTVNRINQVYERDVAVRLVLIPNNDLIIYTNPASDPYSTNASTAINQNQTNLDNVIGSANYDIGHVVSTGTGGLAVQASVCVNGSKARGTTGINPPVGDPFDIDFVAHEIGHQYGGAHTFNGTSGSCGGGNRSALHAYEVGSGSTIMAWAGLCGAQNLQPNSDGYFHRDSLNLITAHITGTGNCGANTSTSNLEPTVSAGPPFIIPSRTPFALTATGSDANGDTLTYAWEEFDLGAANPGTTDNGASPILRSFDPTSSPTRGFPKLADILAGATTYGELLPTTNRTMNFRVTARDNNVLGGGSANSPTTVTSVAAAGPFQITAPNSATSWTGFSAQTITWDVAGTTANGINTTAVRITFSTDGGLTFPFILAPSAPNDGSETISVPNVATTTGRVKVEAFGNIFFDIGNGPITVTFLDTVFYDGFEIITP